ncbi:MAG: DUF4445 domain-containing protein [Geobacter sp.]|nr:DUF4445 domain-containing protein [Geobacter sp.]
MKSTEQYVIAIDAGTTTLAASLLDPGSGRRFASRSALNPQRAFGADVVSRLAYACAAEGNLLELKTALNEGISSLVLGVLADAGVEPASLGRIALAGNPAMEHLLLGLPVNSLAFPPYRPLFTEGRRINTADLGWALSTELYLFPLPGGFVGGDLVAFLYGQGVASPHSPIPGPALFLDIGTNGEIAVSSGSAIYATSAAAGPALEGGNLSCGITATAGAICEVSIVGERLRYSTIGGTSPLGICGSAVIDLVAELVRVGILDASGRLLPPDDIPTNLANCVQKVDGQWTFVVYRDAERLVYLSQEDIRQVQFAKGAIRAGMEVLAERGGLRWEALEKVVLTGSFGACLAPESLKNIGIFTAKMVEICGFVRDGALAGVEKVLCAPAGFKAAESLAASIRVIPLSGTPSFEMHFLEQMNFPEI